MRILLIISALMISLSASATKYYISATGSDSNSGLTALLPKQTITAVNALTLSAGDTVAFKKGDGWLGTLILNASGSSGNPIVYTTYGNGATPTITGFTTITSGWTNEGGGIYSKVISSESQTNMVTIDGIQYGMGRYPNSTFLTWESAVSNTSITDNQLTGTPSWTGAEALIVKNGYTIDRCSITNHSGSTLTYTSLGTSRNSDATGSYFIQNDLKTLDAYGEWYHDYSGTGKFYMYFGAVVPTTKTVKVATLNNLCKVNALKQYNKIENIAFVGSSKDIISAETSCHYLTVQNCDFSFAGLDGIWVDAQNVTISGNTFNYCNRISIHSVGANLTATNNTISNNAVIIGQGNTWTAGLSAMYIYSDNPTVTGNSIQNTGTNGIAMSSAVDNGLIKNNYIYNTCLVNWDHGSIYTDDTHTALKLTGNIIIKSKGSGIYLDEYSSNIAVKNNTVTECDLYGIFLHKANGDSILDNTVYNCNVGLYMANWLNENNLINLVVQGNKFIAKTATQKTLSYATRYTDYTTSFTTWNFSGNVYARPIDDATSLQDNLPSIFARDRSLTQWQTLTSKDVNSTKSPKAITSESDIEIRYNPTSSPVQVSFSWAGINMAGVQYASNPTIPAYSSLVLIKNIPNPTGEKKPAGKNGVMYKTPEGLPIGVE